MQMNKDEVVVERVKIVVRSAIELCIALLANQALVPDYWPWVYCYSMFIFASIRTVYKDHLDLTASIFIIVYFTQNFIVNTIDFCVYKHMMGFYHDEQFLKMFSFKIWQFAMCLLISFIYAQTFKPTFQVILE